VPSGAGLFAFGVGDRGRARGIGRGAGGFDFAPTNNPRAGRNILQIPALLVGKKVPLGVLARIRTRMGRTYMWGVALTYVHIPGVLLARSGTVSHLVPLARNRPMSGAKM
jgi:hypothetical protein